MCAQHGYLCRDVAKGTLRWKNKEIEFRIACCKGYSAGHFDTNIRCLTQYLTFKTTII